MDINSWYDTWGTIDWQDDSEDEIKQKITEFYHDGVDFNMTGLYGEWDGTPLDHAATFSTVGVLELLVDGGADINLKNDIDWTVLHYAASGIQVENVKYLIEHGPKDIINFINTQSTKGWTALHEAACEDRAATIKVLADAGADVNIQNSDGETALHLASKWGCLNSIKTLIEAGADVSIRNNDGNTAMDVAKDIESENVIEMFTQIRADLLKKKLEQQPINLSLVRDQKTR